MKSNIVFFISEDRVKFLQVSGAPKKVVTAVDILNIVNQSDAQISQTIHLFIKSKKINLADSQVTLLIPRSRAILRYMVFPSQKNDEIISMIDLQVASRIPYAREEVEIDFQVLSKTADGYSKVAVVIIAQDIAMRYWKILSDAKVPVHRMTISSIGLWLLYLQQPNLSDKPGAIFDLDVNHSEICLCYKAHWLTSREIPVGFEQIQKEGYAEILKQWQLTQNNTTGEKLTGAVETVYLACSVNRAYTLGVEITKAQEELTIEEITLTQRLPKARHVQWPSAMVDDGVSIAPLAGIAFSSQIPPIDLIPRAVRSAQDQRNKQRQMIVAGVWLMVAAFFLITAFGMDFFKKNLQVSRLEEQLRDTTHDSQMVTTKLQQINEIESVINNRLIFGDLAREINRLLPHQIYLVSFTISDGNNISFQGVSTNAEDVNRFQKDMVQSQYFSNVSLDYDNKRVTQHGNVDYFKISCKLKTAKIQE